MNQNEINIFLIEVEKITLELRRLICFPRVLVMVDWRVGILYYTHLCHNAYNKINVYSLDESFPRVLNTKQRIIFVSFLCTASKKSLTDEPIYVQNTRTNRPRVKTNGHFSPYVQVIYIHSTTISIIIVIILFVCILLLITVCCFRIF